MNAKMNTKFTKLYFEVLTPLLTYLFTPTQFIAILCENRTQCWRRGDNDTTMNALVNAPDSKKLDTKVATLKKFSISPLHGRVILTYARVTRIKILSSRKLNYGG